MHQWPKFCCQPNFPLATISPNKFHISELNIEEVSLSEWNEIDTYVQNLPLSIVDYIWSNFRMNSHAIVHPDFPITNQHIDTKTKAK